jgi:uncharacterized membrane protein (DUF106 family)
MIAEFKEWAAIGVLAVTTLWGYFRLHAQADRMIEFKKDQEELNESVQEDIDHLKENKTKTNTMLENLIKMQEENRLDVKLILQQIATIAAKQANSKSKNDE